MEKAYLLTNIGVVDALKDRVREVTKNFRLNDENKSPSEKEVSVYEQFLPQKKAPTTPDDDSIYPYVVVRFLNEEKNRVEIMLITGTYEPDHQTGWRDACNILNRIKLDLEKNPILGGQFSMVEDSFGVYLPDEQKLPQWAAFAMVSFELPKIQSEGAVEYVF